MRPSGSKRTSTIFDCFKSLILIVTHSVSASVNLGQSTSFYIFRFRKTLAANNFEFDLICKLQTPFGRERSPEWSMISAWLFMLRSRQINGSHLGVENDDQRFNPHMRKRILIENRFCEWHLTSHICIISKLIIASVISTFLGSILTSKYLKRR